MKHLKKMNEAKESNKKWVLTTMSESSDHYIYFIEHPTKPTHKEIERFLSENAHDKDDDGCYEHQEEIKELGKFEKIPE